MGYSRYDSQQLPVRRGGGGRAAAGGGAEGPGGGHGPVGDYQAAGPARRRPGEGSGRRFRPQAAAILRRNDRVRAGAIRGPAGSNLRGLSALGNVSFAGGLAQKPPAGAGAAAASRRPLGLGQAEVHGAPRLRPRSIDPKLQDVGSLGASRILCAPATSGAIAGRAPDDLPVPPGHEIQACSLNRSVHPASPTPARGGQDDAVAEPRYLVPVTARRRNAMASFT